MNPDARDLRPTVVPARPWARSKEEKCGGRNGEGEDEKKKDGDKSEMRKELTERRDTKYSEIVLNNTKKIHQDVSYSYFLLSLSESMLPTRKI